MERCPVCRARIKDDPLCTRCGADLALVLALEARRQALEAQAVGCLYQRDLEGAEKRLAQAYALQRTPFNLTLLGFVCALAHSQGWSAPSAEGTHEIPITSVSEMTPG